VDGTGSESCPMVEFRIVVLNFQGLLRENYLVLEKLVVKPGGRWNCLESCPMTRFDISGVEPSGSATTLRPVRGLFIF
jgi:hypothetical protein